MGGSPEKPFNPKERIGYSIPHPSKVETLKVTPEEKAAREESSNVFDAKRIQVLQAQIGPRDNVPARVSRKGDVVYGMKAPTQEEIAAYQTSQEEARRMESEIKRGNFLSRFANIFRKKN